MMGTLLIDLERLSDTVARIMLTGRQIRGALGLLGENVAWLAQTAVVSEATIRRAILADGVPRMRSDLMVKIQQALESAGILFLDPHDRRDGGEGVRLRPPPASPERF